MASAKRLTEDQDSKASPKDPIFNYVAQHATKPQAKSEPTTHLYKDLFPSKFITTINQSTPKLADMSVAQTPPKPPPRSIYIPVAQTRSKSPPIPFLTPVTVAQTRSKSPPIPFLTPVTVAQTRSKSPPIPFHIPVAQTPLKYFCVPAAQTPPKYFCVPAAQTPPKYFYVPAAQTPHKFIFPVDQPLPKGCLTEAPRMFKPLSSVQHNDSFTGEENSPSHSENLWNQTEKRTTPTSLASTSHNKSKIAFVTPFSRPNTDNVAVASFEKTTLNQASLGMHNKKVPHYKSVSNLAGEEINRSSEITNKQIDKLARHNRSTKNLFRDETIKTSEIQYEQIDQTVSQDIENSKDNKIKDSENLIGIRKTEEKFSQCKSKKSNIDLPEIFSGKLSSEPSIKKEGSIFIGKIFLTSNAAFEFLQTQLTYLEELVKADHCEISLIKNKILVKLKWSEKITVKEVKAFIDKALEKIVKFICLFSVLKFKMKGSQLSDFKTFSKGKMANIFVDYETNEVTAISAKSLKDLEAMLKDLCLRYLQEDVTETNVEVFETFSSQYSEKRREKRDQVLKTYKPATIKSEILFSNGKHLFLRRFLMKEFYANTKKNLDANFKLFHDKCVISGTQESIKRFEEFFNKIMMKIDETEVTLKFFGVQEFLHSNEGQNLLKSTESGNRCVIQLKCDAEPDTLPQQNTSQVAITKTVSQNAWDFGNIKVDVIIGEINKETTDVIVSSVTKHLDLRMGMLSSCILKTAGDIIQAELHLRYPMGINYGDFATSSGGNLQCKHIFHACIPYGYGRNLGEMTDLVIKMLEEAENLKAQSISIPALGTGALGYPLDASANEIFGGIRQFAQSLRQSLIQRVNIVIFPSDTGAAEIFRSILFGKQDIGAESKLSEVQLTDPSNQSVEAEKISQEVDIKIFSDNAHKRQLAAKTLQEECQSAFKEENITDKNLQRLKPDQIKKLENIGLQHRIKVGIEGDQLNMQGFKSDGMLQVQKTKEKLILEAVGQHHQSLLSVIPSSIEWQYKLKDIWITFKPLINSELEKAKNKMYFEYTEDSGTKYNFNLFAMRVVKHTGIEKATYELRRYDKRKEEGEPLPNHWSAMTETENLKVVVIKPGTLEFNTVEVHFKQSGGSHQIKKIERIQNKSLHQQFAAKKREMDLYNPQGHQNERNLFHGTSLQPIPQINENGFNRSFCGVNATVYGKGVYFAVNASYSEKYAVPDAQGNKYMYRVKALTGEFIETNQDTKYLPNKPGSNRPYDSGGNSSRGIYVIFHDAQVYPEYLITF